MSGKGGRGEGDNSGKQVLHSRAHIYASRINCVVARSFDSDPTSTEGIKDEGRRGGQQRSLLLSFCVCFHHCGKFHWVQSDRSQRAIRKRCTYYRVSPSVCASELGGLPGPVIAVEFPSFEEGSFWALSGPPICSCTWFGFDGPLSVCPMMGT